MIRILAKTEYGSYLYTWYQAYLCIPSKTAVAAASARVNYTPDRTQAKLTKKLRHPKKQLLPCILPHEQP